MLNVLSMTGPRAQDPAEFADHPLRAALARGDRMFARSGPALHHMLAARDRSLVSDAVVAQVSGMLADLAQQLAGARGLAPDATARAAEAIAVRLLTLEGLRSHCHALALEWWLTLRLERDLALDPVLSPLLQLLIAQPDPATGALAMAVLAAQARFAQAQRRMQLPLGELPAELFHAVLLAARDITSEAGGDAIARAESGLRAAFDEGASRFTLLARLAGGAGSATSPSLRFLVEHAGVALWLSALAVAADESRERAACAAVDPQLGRLLLSLRAAGVSPAEAERQALTVQPDAALPRGLQDVGTREAAQWLAEARR